MKNSIQEDRKTFIYRFLEASIGLTSIGFLLLLIILSVIDQTRNLVSLFLIIYSFLWVLKLSINSSFTIYTYKQLRRWEKFKWQSFFEYAKNDWEEAKNQLIEFRDKYKNTIDWEEKINADISQVDKIKDTKFANIADIYHVNIFSIYNESAEVLLKSLKCIYESKYNLSKLIIIVSQEARNGEKNNSKVSSEVAKMSWVNANFVSEANLDIVYSQEHYCNEQAQSSLQNYSNPIFQNIEIKSDKLNIIFTQHPDGLIGEVKGKASNEDWAGRQASLFIKSKKIDPEMVLVTSLDADSHISNYFYHNLSYRFCLTENRLDVGYQPVHAYSNNFFQTGVWPRIVAAQTTLHNMSQLAIDNETSFFAIYSAPLVVLQKVDFWVREVIAEDSTLFIKCLAYFKGNFKVIPFYGVFEGDAVEADDYIEAILVQYKQLQRWSWGGIEGFPYMFKKFFLEKNSSEIDLRVRIRWIFLVFTNHFFWASTPIIFSVGVLLPQLIGGDVFRSQPIAQNLLLFSQYFTLLSFVFLAIFSYITFVYLGVKAKENSGAKWYNWIALAVQCIASPLVYGIMGIPALDAQIRGIFGKYLTYLVTPKK